MRSTLTLSPTFVGRDNRLRDPHNARNLPLERSSPSTSVIDVLDRVLDKGIVIDVWLRLAIIGIDLITVEARVVVASIETYLTYASAIAEIPPGQKPQ